MLYARRFVPISRLLAACLTFSVVLCSPAIAEDAKTIVDAAQATMLRIKPTSDQVSVDAGSDGIDITIQPGESGYPGVAIGPADEAAWDLSAFGHVEARVTNTGDQPLGVSLRVDNEGPWQNKPFNTESRQIKPGETGSIKVIFGHSYGYQPSFKLDPARVKQVMLFTGKAGVEKQFRIETIQAAGAVGEVPQRGQPKPKPKTADPVLTDGAIFGRDTEADKSLTIRAVGGDIVAREGALLIDFAAGAKQHRAAVRPRSGRWNLRDHLEVRVALTNLGEAPVSPRVQVESPKGHTAWATTDRPIAPGQSAQVVVPFISPTVWQGPQDLSTGKSFKGTQGTRFASNIVSGVAVEVEPSNEATRLRIDSITAGVPAATTPGWLGQRPPVEGDWVSTFAEEFDGDQLEAATWGIYGSNFWDKKSHFSKDNVVLGDGVVRLRFEKKRGYHNDDPDHSKGESDYATGYLHTYGKWTQLYGYFEARMKLPTAPGLWPAFWMMPDRGNPDDPQWKRQDTADGGMEFDIMEHLTRWGPNRYTTAMHWDGYQKNHKVTGAAVYAQPDEDGYIVAGLLWEPGLAVYYCNGREVARWEHERISSVPSDLMFTLPTGGWDNDPLDDATLPDDFVIDYVRCWQRRERMSP